MMTGYGIGRAVRPKLAETWPEHLGAGQSSHSAGHVNDRRARKVQRSMAEAEILAEHRQPPAAPYPVGVEGIDDHGDEKTVDHEILERPSFSHRTCGNGGGGVHEHHLKQEESENRSVVGHARKKEALRPEQPEILTEKSNGRFTVEKSRSAGKTGHAADAAHLEGKSTDPVAEHAYAIDHEIHGHGVARISCARETRFGHGEPRLHEHDEKPGHESPHHVDGDTVVADHVCEFRRKGFVDGKFFNVLLRGSARGGADHE